MARTEFVDTPTLSANVTEPLRLQLSSYNLAERSLDDGGYSANITVQLYAQDNVRCDILPLRTKGLKKVRLIKNVRMETRIELYRETGMGSGQVAIDELPGFIQ